VAVATTGADKSKWAVANTLVLLYALIPVLWIVSLSFKTADSITDGSFIPREWTLENYTQVFGLEMFTSALVNSIGIAVIATVLAVVIGTETVSWTWKTGAVAALGFAAASAIWWLYFDFLDTAVMARSIVSGQVYLFAHIPLLIGLTALGVGVKLAIKASVDGGLPAGAAWTMGGGIALVLGALAVIHVVTVPVGVDVDVVLRVVGAVVALGAAALGEEIGALALSALLATLLVAELLVELARHGGHLSSDLELDGDEVEGGRLPIPMDSHAHGAADQVADH
jgi:ABC-type spermidine/putrescine transport system permease subunit II